MIDRFSPPITAKLVATLSFVCAAIGLLLVFEVVRPFHEMDKDGPLAISCFVLGGTAGTASYFLRPRSLVITILASVANLVPLTGVLGVIFVLSRSTLIWH